MREIKFRAWNKEQKIMCYQNEDESAEYQDGAYGSDVQILNSLLRGYLERYEWMQFTGLHDKNGLTDIYEGDIIDIEGNIRGNIYESPQVFREGIDCIIAGMGTSAWRGTESIAMGRGCQYSE